MRELTMKAAAYAFGLVLVGAAGMALAQMAPGRPAGPSPDSQYRLGPIVSHRTLVTVSQSAGSSYVSCAPLKVNVVDLTCQSDG